MHLRPQTREPPRWLRAPSGRCPFTHSAPLTAAGKHPAAEPSSSRPGHGAPPPAAALPPRRRAAPRAGGLASSAPLRAGRAPAPALPRGCAAELLLLTVLLLGAGEGELAAEVGLGGGPLPPASQGRCQQEQPEEEHWAGGARGSGTAGTGGAAPRPGRLSAAPGAGCAAGEKAALSLLWQQRIAG